MVSTKLINRLQLRWDITGTNYAKLQKQSLEALMKDDKWCEDFRTIAWKYALETGDRIWNEAQPIVA